ncbi:unnamed protein product, partial [marine sediment metagenome]
VAEAVEAKLAEGKVKETPVDGDELTDDDIKTIVAEAVSSALTAATGELPV